MDPFQAPRDPDEASRGVQFLPILKVEAQLDSFGPRRHVMRAAKRGKEVVQGRLVHQVDDRETQAPPVMVITTEEVVVPYG